MKSGRLCYQREAISHALVSPPRDAPRLFAATSHVVDERPVDVGATEADGTEEGIEIRHKVLAVS